MEDNPPIVPALRGKASTDHDEAAEPVAISVAATQAVPGQPVAVTGYVVVSAGIATISEMLAESYPPQPGGSWLRIQNPEQLELGQAQRFNDTTWTSEPVRLVGRRVDEAFVISDPSVDAVPAKQNDDPGQG